MPRIEKKHGLWENFYGPLLIAFVIVSDIIRKVRSEKTVYYKKYYFLNSLSRNVINNNNILISPYFCMH